MAKFRKKLNRRDAIYQIALAGISSAVALLFVWLGTVVRFSTVAFYIAGGLALMVPLAKRYYVSGFFAYAVASALGFVIAGDIATVAGFVVYFGPMSLITGIMFNKKVKWFISVPVKVVYINGALALLYFVCHTIMIDVSIMDRIQYWMVALVGTLALILIDFALQFIYSRIIPIVEKTLRTKTADLPAQEQSRDDDSEDDEVQNSPFDDDSPFNDV